MIESKIDELLVKLQKLDPDTWLEIRKNVDVPPWIVIGSWSKKMIWTLQGVILDATSDPERNLALVIEYPVTDSDWWGVELMHRATGISRFRIGPTLAETLLAAYVAALEAEAAR